METPQHPSPALPAPRAPALSPDSQVPWLPRCVCLAQKSGLEWAPCPSRSTAQGGTALAKDQAVP